MRHGKKINHLSRKTAHRGALLSNMACSLIEHKRINTTLAKAKALRKYVEPLITKSKDDTTHNRRVVFSYLKNKDASSILFRDIAPKINDRPGGYTRIIKLNNRLGDNAEMAMIELVDFNELLTKDQAKKKKTRRRGAKKASTSNETDSNTAKSDDIEDAVVVEETKDNIVDEPTSEKNSDDNSSDDKPTSKEDIKKD
jgi:large subunit ribosomal protein L17